jgi:hypothetical protein
MEQIVSYSFQGAKDPDYFHFPGVFTLVLSSILCFVHPHAQPNHFSHLGNFPSLDYKIELSHGVE